MQSTQLQESTSENSEIARNAPQDPFRRNLESPGPRAILTVLAATLLILVAAECLARILVSLAAFPDMRNSQTEAKMQVAKSVAALKEPVIIFTGDSCGTGGIYADYIERQLRDVIPNVKVVNLATSGSCHEEKSVLIKTALGEHAGPRLVIYQISSNLLEKELADAADPLQHFKQTYIGSYKIDKPKNFLEYCKNVANENSYLVRYQRNWQALLTSLIPRILETEKHTWRGTTPLIAKECSPGGWTPIYDFPEENENLDQYTQVGWAKFYAENGRLMSTEWQWDGSRVSQMKEMCEKNGVPLMYLWLPELASKTSNYTVKHFSAEQCVKRVSSMLGKDAEQLIDLSGADNDEFHFRNWNHLTIPGVISTSDMITERLAKSPFLLKNLKKVNN